MTSFWKNKKILITGGRGFVGSHVVENLILNRHVDPSQIVVPHAKMHDLRIFENVKEIIKDIDIVLHLAADVGGIGYSTIHPATQMKNCLLMDLNMFEAASEEKVEKFVCISSAVAYPEGASTPYKEEDIFNGLPSKGGYGYGFAKRMSVVMAKAYREEKGLNAVVLLPSNTFGPRDNFDLERGHVIPSLIRKCLTQKELIIWGNGEQVRDFFYVKDFAEGVVLAGEKLNTADPVNISSGVPVTIKELVETVVRLTHFKGKIIYDISKPQGQKIRFLDIEKARNVLDFKPQFSLEESISETIDWYLKNSNGKD